MKRGSTEIVSTWAADPPRMARLEQLVLLTSRISIIQRLMEIPDEELKQLRGLVKVIRRNHQLPESPARGGEMDRSKASTNPPAKVRFALAVLIGIHLSTGYGSVSGQGKLLTSDVLDRLILSFHRYLQLQRLQILESPVNFETFVKTLEAIEMGAAVLEPCGNCGSFHPNFKADRAHNCPICSSLGLAEVARSKLIHPIVKKNIARTPLGQLSAWAAK